MNSFYLFSKNNKSVSALLIVFFLALSACSSKPEKEKNTMQGLPPSDLAVDLPKEYPVKKIVILSDGLGDDDGDGVINVRDKCNEKLAENVEVNNEGCSHKLSDVKTLNLSINFAKNSRKINKKYFSEIKKIADIHKKNPNYTILIEGHTDSRGKRSANVALSKSRAESVANFLIKKYGIPKNKVLASGMGASEPIATNDTEEGRQKNRRMVAHLVYDDRVVALHWNIWAVELDRDKKKIKKFYSLENIE